MRPHISFFGMRNAGKSSVVNAVTGQELAIVSDRLGTTTDPVQKAMELLPLGPVVIIDTPGFDDEGEIGRLRVQKAKRILNKTDIAVLVVDVTKGLSATDRGLIDIFEDKRIPYVVAYNKCDLASLGRETEKNEIEVSAVTKTGINELKEKLVSAAALISTGKLIIGDRLKKGDIIVLVIPIDEAAPKGRIILPQQNVLREALDAGACALCVQPPELKGLLASLKKKPKYVITDSQAFKEVASDVPEEIVLSSFSVLMAEYKGYLRQALGGIRAIPMLKDGSRVLIAEGCTHHRQCNDIGTVKVPKMLKKLTGAALEFETCSGVEFPEELEKYALIVHCGGCMLNEREMLYRMKCAADANVPVTNYGLLFAHFNKILDRSLEIFKD